MRILWISPYGEGWSMAEKLRQLGHKVVLINCENKNGLGYLPMASKADLEHYVNRADTVVVDSTFESRKTRRSWEPSDNVLAISAMVKKRGVPYVGPTPTTELLENDPRYLGKMLRRFGIPVRIKPAQLAPEVSTRSANRLSMA